MKTLAEQFAEWEAGVIRYALTVHPGRMGEAAKALGISRKNLWEKLRKYNIIKEEVWLERQT